MWSPGSQKRSEAVRFAEFADGDVGHRTRIVDRNLEDVVEYDRDVPSNCGFDEPRCVRVEGGGERERSEPEQPGTETKEPEEENVSATAFPAAGNDGRDLTPFPAEYETR